MVDRLYKLLGLWCKIHNCRLERHMAASSAPGAVDYERDCPVCTAQLVEQWMFTMRDELLVHYGSDYDTTIPGKEFDAEVLRIIARHAPYRSAAVEELVRAANFVITTWNANVAMTKPIFVRLSSALAALEKGKR